MTWLLCAVGVIAFAVIVITLRFAQVLTRPQRDTLERGIALQMERGNLKEGEYDTFAREPFSFKTDDGLTLNGYRFPCGLEKSKGVVILVHGYSASQVHMLKNVKLYNKLGFDCVTYDNRACGTSEGKSETMGVMEKLDLDRLYKIERSRMNVLGRTPRSGCIVATHGESMGAATVVLHACMLAKKGETLPDFTVEDCGYARLMDQLKRSAKDRAHVPLWLIKPLGIPLIKLMAGYDIRLVAPADELMEQGEALAQTPMLFIHGTEDKFVPCESVYKLFDAKSGIKRLRVFEGAEHVRSISHDREGYERTVTEFLRENNF